MSTWLDIVGSFIIGSIIILILVNINAFIGASSTENLFSNIAQESLSTTSFVMENDFYKIGYGVSGNNISIADSNEIKFSADLDDDGDVDTLHYYTGSKDDFTSSPNPNDKMLYRIFNNMGEKPFSAVVNFKLTYYDSSGGVLNYGSLNSQVHRNRIRTILIDLLVESAEPVDSNYQGAVWRRRINPRNIIN